VRTLFPTIDGVPVDASTETVPVVVPESVVVWATASDGLTAMMPTSVSAREQKRATTRHHAPDPAGR
jgi:hypothetical protein